MVKREKRREKEKKEEWWKIKKKNKICLHNYWNITYTEFYSVYSIYMLF